MSLRSSQTRYLRGLAHALKPVVHVGKSGASDAVGAEVDRALVDHELIKVRLPALAKDARLALAGALSASCRAELVQVLGHVAVLYRRHPDSPKIVLPR